MSAHSASSSKKHDPCGHGLLAHRLDQIPGELAGMLVRGLCHVTEAATSSKSFFVTGTGSSEAHARYFCHLVNLYTRCTASFIPLSGFLAQSWPTARERTLVVFSQGVSPNAQIALRRHKDFAHTVLFTSTTPDLARKAGKPERADLLSDLVEAGGDLVFFPLGEEYSALIRFVGPMCGYLACLQFVAKLEGCSFSPPRPGQLLPLLGLRPPAELSAAMHDTPALFSQGFNLICSAPVSDYSQNLACKFMEGLFWSCPLVSDFLQFAHGPFQQSNASPRPVLILQGDHPAEQELVRRSLAMLETAGLPAYVIQVPALAPYSIFGFEAVFNQLVFATMQHLGTDQLNWPGKGRDDMLYGFCADPSKA